MKNLSIQAIKDTAKELIDKDRVSEYTRGICELIADIDGKKDTPHDHRSKEVALELGVLPEIAKQMW